MFVYNATRKIIIYTYNIFYKCYQTFFRSMNDSVYIFYESNKYYFFKVVYAFCCDGIHM